MSTVIYSQNLLFSGRVLSKNSGKVLSNVTIKVNDYTAYSDRFGEFSLNVDQMDIQKNNIEFSLAGYKDRNIKPIYGFLTIELDDSTAVLPEVYVHSSIRNLIKKVILKLDSNYYIKPLHFNAITRLQYIIAGKSYFKSDANLDVYSSPYYSKRSKEIKIISKITNTETNHSIPFIRWEGAYLAAEYFDMAHQGRRPSFLTISKMNDFDYKLLQKVKIDSNTNYHIDFFQKNRQYKNRIEGSFWIDSQSLAITQINVIRYNVISTEGLSKSKTFDSISYIHLNGKWIIQKIHHEGYSIYKNLTPISLIDLVVNNYDTTNTTHIKYQEKIQESDITQNIGEELRINKNDSTFLTAAVTKEIPAPQNFSLDNMTPKKQGIKIIDYINYGNIKYSLSIVRLPIRMNDTKYVFPKTTPYGIALGLYFKLLKDTYFEFDGAGNFNNRQSIVSEYRFGLTRDLYLVKSGHTVIISPSLQYSLLSINDKLYGQKRIFNNLNISYRVSYEFMHNFSLIGTVGSYVFNNISNEYNFSLYKPSYSFGIMLRK